MRAVILAVLCGLALAPTPLQAAPVPTKALPGGLGVAPPVELVRDGCGRGWHRHHWRDHWGHWHWGHCVPYVGGRTKLEHPYSDWRGPTGGLGNP